MFLIKRSLLQSLTVLKNCFQNCLKKSVLLSYQRWCKNEVVSLPLFISTLLKTHKKLQNGYFKKNFSQIELMHREVLLTRKVSPRSLYMFVHSQWDEILFFSWNLSMSFLYDIFVFILRWCHYILGWKFIMIFLSF